MARPLHERVLEHVRDARLFPAQGRALVAVSGGSDSIGLALVLHRIAARLGIELVIGHVDHGIQPDSMRAADRVAALADNMGVPHVRRTLALGPATSETKARQARYVALWDMYASADCRYLVTAHHADDQVETVLLRFLRGSGVAGLAGIPAFSSGGLVRPLLAFRKEEVVTWLREDDVARALSVPGYSDPSNRDQKHDRAWVRHVALPLARRRFDRRVHTAILETAANASDERAAWQALLYELPDLGFEKTIGFVQVARKTLHQYDPKLSLALLRAAAREAGCVLGPARARRVWLHARDAPSGRTFELGDGWVLETIFDDLRIRKLDDGEGAVNVVGWGGTEVGEIVWCGWSLSWRPDDASTVGRAGLVTWVTPGGGQVRMPRPGDRIRPVHGRGRRKVSRLLMEGKVPWPERSNYPVLTRGSEILWLPGICRSDCDVPQTGKKAVRIDARRN